MKNREKYAQEIIDIVATSDEYGYPVTIAVEKSSGKPRICLLVKCKDCLFKGRCTCEGARKEWLNAEYPDDTETVKQVIEYLNSKTGKRFRPTNKAAKRVINARLNEGYTLDDFRKVIDIKADEWTGTEYEKYLNPETLFGNKMDKYLNQPVQKPMEDKRSSKWGD